VPRALLTEQEVRARLAKLPGWELREDRIRREYAFADFSEAFAFMTRVALVAEKLDHHPDWSNVWNRVEIALWTHDAGGITERDFTLAQEIARLASTMARA
jgi:4a-hydroxytetrahydrobiopterin dehydratase